MSVAGMQISNEQNELLERIAVALEKLVENKEEK